MVKDLLVEFRLKSGLSKSEIARRLGIAPQLYGDYELGQRNPKQDFFVKYKEVFKIDLTNVMKANASLAVMSFDLGFKLTKEEKEKIAIDKANIAAETTHTYGKEAPSNLPQEAVLKLIDANKDASKANLVHAEARLVEAENNKQLITMVKATAGVPAQSQAIDSPILNKIQELLIDVLTGKQFRSREEATIEVYKSFGGSAPFQG